MGERGALPRTTSLQRPDRRGPRGGRPRVVRGPGRAARGPRRSGRAVGEGLRPRGLPRSGDGLRTGPRRARPPPRDPQDRRVRHRASPSLSGRAARAGSVSEESRPGGRARGAGSTARRSLGGANSLPAGDVPAAREAHVLSLGRRRHQPFSWSASRCLLDLTLLTPRTHATDQPRKFVTSRQWLLMWECQSEPSQAEKPGLLVGSDIGLDLKPYP